MASHQAPSLLTPVTPSLPLCPPVTEKLETLPTPPDSTEPFRDKSTKLNRKSLKRALHVLSTERDALGYLVDLYSTSSTVQAGFSSAISNIIASQIQHGKVIFTGVGKSGWIAQKLVATFNSVGIVSVFLHPTEALHGDLGIIRPHDVVIMITYSGRTPELLTLSQHIPTCIPVVVMTSHVSCDTCQLFQSTVRTSSNSILLPTPIHITEKEAFGLPAPTSSTTVALALGDSLALATADRIHRTPGQGPADVFAQHHPGGAIGADHNTSVVNGPKMSDLAVHVNSIPTIDSSEVRQLRCLDILLAAVRSPKGWIKTSPRHMISPRRIQQLSRPELGIDEVQDGKGNIVVDETDWISVLGECTLEECKQWIIKMRTEGDCRGKQFLRPGTILGIVDRQSQKSGVVEIEEVVGDDFCGTL